MVITRPPYLTRPYLLALAGPLKEIYGKAPPESRSAGHPVDPQIVKGEITALQFGGQLLNGLPLAIQPAVAGAMILAKRELQTCILTKVDPCLNLCIKAIIRCAEFSQIGRSDGSSVRVVLASAPHSMRCKG